MASRLTFAAAAAVILAACAGCKYIGAATYFLSPPKIEKADFILTEGKLAIVTETANASEENQVFNRTLHATLIDIFREEKIKSQVIPYSEQLALRQTNSDFNSWSLQRVGRELGAEQVLYIRLDRLQFKESPDHPLIEPRVALHVKVIGVNEPSVHARLWPERPPEGKELACSRQTREAAGAGLADEEAAKLARDTAHLLARFFYDVNVENKPPRER